MTVAAAAAADAAAAAACAAACESVPVRPAAPALRGRAGVRGERCGRPVGRALCGRPVGCAVCGRYARRALCGRLGSGVAGGGGWRRQRRPARAQLAHRQLVHVAAQLLARVAQVMDHGARAVRRRDRRLALHRLVPRARRRRLSLLELERREPEVVGEVGLERLLDAEQLVVLADGALERVAVGAGAELRAVHRRRCLVARWRIAPEIALETLALLQGRLFASNTPIAVARASAEYLNDRPSARRSAVTTR